MKLCFIPIITFFYTSVTFSANRVFSCSLKLDTNHGYMISLSSNGKGILTIDYDGRKYSCDLILNEFLDLRKGVSVVDVFEFHARRTQCNTTLSEELDRGFLDKIIVLGQKISGKDKYFTYLLEGSPPVLCKISMIDKKNLFKLKDLKRHPLNYAKRKKKAKILHVLKSKMKKYLKK